MDEIKAKRYWVVIRASTMELEYYEDDYGHEQCYPDTKSSHTYFFSSDDPKEIDVVEEDFISRCDESYNANILAESDSMKHWRRDEEYKKISDQLYNEEMN